MALLIDWGGVLTTSMLDSFDAFARREGADVRTAFSADGAARAALVDLETGAIDITIFEARLGQALDAALSICALLIEGEHLSSSLSNTVFTLAASANRGAAPQLLRTVR